VVGCKGQQQTAGAPAAGSGSGSGSGAAEAGMEAEAAARWAALLGLKGPGRRAPAGRGTLAAVIKNFAGYEPCLQAVAEQLPPDVGGELLGRLQLPDAICRTREAISNRSPASCHRVRSYQLRRGCQTLYAIYNRAPDSCPGASPSRFGRDGYCLALAERNPALCLAARLEARRVACRAVLAGDPKACQAPGLKHPGERRQCESDVARWASLMGQVQSSLPENFAPLVTLKIEPRTGIAGSASLPAGEQRLYCADYGAAVPRSGAEARIQLCDFYRTNYRRAFREYPGRRRQQLRLRMDFVAPDSPTGVVRFGEGASLSIRGGSRAQYGTDPQGEIRFSRFERRRGARITGSFTVSVSGPGQRVKVAGTFDTFVRDLVNPARLRPRFPRRYPGRPGTRSGGLLGLLGRRDQRPRPGLPAEARPARKRFPALYSAATLKPHSQGGKRGLLLTAILANSLWHRLGLRDGDLLLKAGTTPMLSIRDVRQVRRQLRQGTSLRLEILRGGRPRTLRLSAARLNDLRQEFAL
jgi:hypothetical protein